MVKVELKVMAVAGGFGWNVPDPLSVNVPGYGPDAKPETEKLTLCRLRPLQLKVRVICPPGKPA
ncbi:MAG: hypothetical protein E6H88_03385 [Chloroflexi bacterium]|nr:MAG: hypothetical protein E6H88_03385 [Chloroflexota bacterium]